MAAWAWWWRAGWLNAARATSPYSAAAPKLRPKALDLLIKSLGATVYPLQGDVADEAAMAALLAQLRADAPPLRGVMHAAAALSSAPLVDLSAMQVSEMLSPKLAGTLALERLTRSHQLDFLVLFSSTTALLGASGLAHYAAANAFLDAFAQVTNRKRRVLSVNWGTWEVMRLATADNQWSYREAGLQPMVASDALEALGHLIGSTQGASNGRQGGLERAQALARSPGCAALFGAAGAHPGACCRRPPAPKPARA